MIVGIGVDIIELDRIAQAIARHGNTFTNRLFTKREQTQSSTSFYAGRFAAKEAVVKALGTGFRGIDWKDIEILADGQGKPVVIVAEHIAVRFGNPKLHLTISHSKEHACAFCIWER